MILLQFQERRRRRRRRRYQKYKVSTIWGDHRLFLVMWLICSWTGTEGWVPSPVRSVGVSSAEPCRDGQIHSVLWAINTPTLPNDSSILTTAKVSFSNKNTKEQKNDDFDDDGCRGVEIIPPGGRFRETKPGEFSIVTYNALAPLYHTLRLPIEERDVALVVDRSTRVPHSIATAIRTGADVLCLQEVEGGVEELTKLRKLLLSADGNGYDECLWTPLNPKRIERGDMVGLATAWRSSKFRLVGQDLYRRGMVVQLQDIVTNATVCIGNVHLPARPAAVEARLRFTASTVRRLRQQQLASGGGGAGGGGPAILCGDLNCEDGAPNLRYLERGHVPHGTLRDRNYRMRISKKAASALGHPLRFQHAYANEPDCAAVTVSLRGRGPGCMDHLYYTPNPPRKSVSAVESYGVPVREKKGKRSSRRDRISTRPQSYSSAQQPNIQVASLLATTDQNNTERTQLIRDGLPNESASFYSDHLPVGALFVPVTSRPRTSSNSRSSTGSTTRGGLSTQAQQRRTTFRKSAVVRQRHNAILRVIVDTLQRDFVAPILRDVPLYKWPWIQQRQRQGCATGTNTIKKKGRAPDLCCLIDQTLIVLEVTVVAAEKVNDAYREKRDKYQDVINTLAADDSVAVQQAGLSVVDHALVICLDESGNLATESQQDLKHLVKLCGREVDSLTQELVQEFRTICHSFDSSPSL